jgi:NAD(P)-dependent dehydrogenase (short-subunit alcohol dehydrogenase family)
VADGSCLQGYNSSKTALNALTVYFAATLRAKHPEAVVVAVTPGYCATVRSCSLSFYSLLLTAPPAEP